MTVRCGEKERKRGGREREKERVRKKVRERGMEKRGRLREVIQNRDRER